MRLKTLKRWIECTQEDSTYIRDLFKEIELLDWVLENMKNPDIEICNLIESKNAPKVPGDLGGLNDDGPK